MTDDTNNKPPTLADDIALVLDLADSECTSLWELGKSDEDTKAYAEQAEEVLERVSPILFTLPELIAERDRLANIVRDHEAQIIRMTAERAELAEALRGVLPYALSRVEDMDEAEDSPDVGAGSPELEKARLAFDRADVLVDFT